mgnify:CR=1 FL=1
MKKITITFLLILFVWLIKTNSDQLIKTDDESIYKKSSTRKFPRHTFTGNERCEMALKDLLFGINFCKKVISN